MLPMAMVSSLTTVTLFVACFYGDHMPGWPNLTMHFRWFIVAAPLFLSLSLPPSLSHPLCLFLKQSVICLFTWNHVYPAFNIAGTVENLSVLCPNHVKKRWCTWLYLALSYMSEITGRCQLFFPEIESNRKQSSPPHVSFSVLTLDLLTQ